MSDPQLKEPVQAPTQRKISSPRLTALIVACALFMQNLDSTVVATALPAMARAFGADPLHMNVALTSYMLSLAVFIPVSGWMADRYGSRNVFRAAILVFTIGSVLCGRATNLPFLVGARILQGAGGALMVPVGRLLLLRAVAKTDLVAAMAWLTMPALLGPVVGPPIGGFIVTYASWPLIFDLNVPIGVLGIALVTRYITEVREPGTRRLDVRGLALSSLSLAALMVGLETAGRGVLPGVFVAGLLAVGALAAAGYAWHARRHPEPLLDFGLLKLPTFAVSVTAGSLFRVGVGAIPFLLPLMLQLGFGETAAQSGLVTFASSAGALAMKPIATGTLRRFGFRNTLIWNTVLSAAFLGACALFRPTWPAAAIYAVLLVGGFVRSLQFTAYNSIAYADVPRERMSAATSLYSTLQQLSLALGITGGAAVLEAATAFSGHGKPTLMDFSAGFVAVAVVALFAAPVAWALPADAGDEMSGHGVRRE